MKKLLALLALLVGCDEPRVEGSEVQTTDNGRTLFAEYLRPDSGDNVPVMMLVHQPGADNSREDFDLIWSGLNQVGFALLSIDLAGHGDSPSIGDIADLTTDPAGWPEDLYIWQRWLQRRVDEDEEPIDPDSLAIIGLGTGGSLAAGAVGGGLASCAVSVSPTREEVDALAPGFVDGGGFDDLELHDILWMAGTDDEPANTDLVDLEAATSGETRSTRVPCALYGREVLADDPQIREDAILWCTDKV